MTYNYRYWTAFREADLLKAGDHSINNGDSFTMPGAATVKLAAYDNDGQLSGDNNDKATDSDGHYDQYGWVNDGSGWQKTGDLYVEKVFTLKGSDGKTYHMAEIEGEGHDAAGEGDDYFSFVGAVPPAGVTLKVVSNADSHGVNYNDLSADAPAHVNNAPTFDNAPANGVIHVNENETAVIDLNASDADGDTLTYEITGGADAAFFNIDAATGKLTFKNAPDFENPADVSGHNNVYDVTITVSDGNGGSDTKAMWVKVQDVDENTGGGELECVVIEAEDMNAWGFNTVHGANASGGEMVRINKLGGTGDLSTTFEGGSGTYDLTLFAQDESDGQSTVMVKVNGEVVQTIKLDGDNNGGGSNNGHFSEFTVEGLELNTGDTVGLWAQSDSGEYVRIDKIKLQEVEAEEVDPNMVCLDFEGLTAGTVVDQQFDGVMISAQRATHNTAANDAMIFDSNNPTGGDHDLETNNQNNILIISEDNDSNDPDDAIGGTIWFKFDNPASVDSIKVIDAEEGGTIRLLDENGQLIKTVNIPNGTDGGIQTVEIDAEGVAQIDLTLNGSGAVDDLKYIPGEAPATASLGGTYFMDNNDNSVQDGGDMVIAGATVQLFQNGQFVGSTTTDADGNYLFEDLAPGAGYTVRFMEQDGKTFVEGNVGGDDTVDSDVTNVGTAGNGNTGAITLGAGEDKRNVDAGVEVVDPGTASLAGKVFMDNNDNNVEDAGDMAVAGVTVTLSNGQTAVTDANGEYEFTGLAAGDYTVTFPTEFEGKTLVDSNVGGDDTIDSDADEGTGSTGTITLGIGERSEDNDAGLEVVDTGDAVIRGRVFMDNNDNSVDDNGDMGVAGVTVTLSNGDTTVTDADGNYEFTGLPAGDYTVTFPTEVDGKVLVDSNVGGDDTVDSDAGANGSTGTITVGIGEVSEDNDAGVEDPGTASLAGKVFMDNNDNNVEDAGDMAVAGVTVTLSNGQTAVTDANGEYEFTGLAAGDYTVTFPTEFEGKTLVDSNVGGDDTIDSDADEGTGSTGTITLGIGERSEDNDAGLEVVDTGDAVIRGRVFMDNNDNSVDDNGDMGVAGVTVTLSNGDTTVTDADGNYEFTGLPAGDYTVTFPTEVDGKVLVDSNVGGDDTVDSDAGANGSTGTITVGIGEVSDNNDAGVEDPGTASIGDKVFLDANGNGQQDPGEQGVDGVQVTLFNAAGMAISTITTTNGGMYLFDELDAGDYTVGFEAPDGFDLTQANIGNDASDSDADQGTGRTGTINLEIGEAERTVDAGLVEENDAPVAGDDEAIGCAEDDIVVDVLANDSDPDGDAIAVTSVGGQAIIEGETVTVDGVEISLVGGQLVFNGSAQFEDLNIGEEATVSYDYHVSDGNGGVTEASVEVTFKGDANSVQDLFDSLPASGSYQIAADNEADPIGDSAYDMLLNGTGDARFDGVVFNQAYCLSFFDPLNAAETFADAPSFAADVTDGKDGSVFLAGQTSFANGNAAADNLDLVNYILAQDYENDASGQYTGWEVQLAIWELTDDVNSSDIIALDPAYGDQADVDAIVADAIANGEGFMAGTGDITSFIVDPNPATATNSQPFIVAIDFEDFDCLC
jgi:uncharacterized protein (DUF2141 family)